MGLSPTIIMCPNCKVAQPCRSITLGNFNDGGVEVRKSRRECTKCGHKFCTAEISYHDLEMLQDDRRELGKARFRNIILKGDPRGQADRRQDVRR
jgi:transcriptional regulator NrdR family protein